MSITDELREWAKTLTHWWYDPVKDEYTYTTGIMPPSIDAIRLDSSITAIVDRIDAAHEEALSQAYMDVSDLEWIRLPKDADGEYIRVGDVLDGYGKTIEVVELRYGRSGWVLISRDGNGYADTFAFTHYHAPTVEDVLREFANEVYADADNEIRDRDFLCAKYAKRLTLAEGVDA